jgi:hypothetical protein
MSFSGALRQTKTLAGLIHLLRNRQWGQGFSDLDGVSVVGALVWLVKSAEWQQLQQEGSVGQEQWQAQRTVLTIIEVRFPLVIYSYIFPCLFHVCTRSCIGTDTMLQVLLVCSTCAPSSLRHFSVLL